MIDQASVFAERYKGNPQVLQATVLGQGNVPGLDPYTALNALKLIKESNMMQWRGGHNNRLHPHQSSLKR